MWTGIGCILGAVVSFAVLVFGLQILRITTSRESLGKAICLSNLKRVGVALKLYSKDYNGMLPSSYLYGHSKTWNRDDFCRFAMLKDPPPGSATYYTALLPYMRDRGSIWCPSDPARNGQVLSYYYKAAIDRAWYGNGTVSAKILDDFEYPSDQMIFWEHNDWHWGQQADGMADNATFNAAYLDGHTASKRVQNSGYTRSENPPSPLPRSGKGEPAWFNCNMETEKTSLGQNWNPKVYGDNLP